MQLVQAKEDTVSKYAFSVVLKNSPFVHYPVRYNRPVARWNKSQ